MCWSFSDIEQKSFLPTFEFFFYTKYRKPRTSSYHSRVFIGGLFGLQLPPWKSIVHTYKLLNTLYVFAMYCIPIPFDLSLHILKVIFSEASERSGCKNVHTTELTRYSRMYKKIMLVLSERSCGNGCDMDVGERSVVRSLKWIGEGPEDQGIAYNTLAFSVSASGGWQRQHLRLSVFGSPFLPLTHKLSHSFTRFNSHWDKLGPISLYIFPFLWDLLSYYLLPISQYFSSYNIF